MNLELRKNNEFTIVERTEEGAFSIGLSSLMAATLSLPLS